MKRHFDIARFLLLLKLELFRSRKALLIAFEISFGMLFFFGFILENLLESKGVYNSLSGGYAFILIIGGFVLSSMAFDDLGDSLKSYTYLTLPVSAFEKFLCMWLLTSVGWIMLFTVSFVLYAAVVTHLGNVFFRHLMFVPFDPFGDLALTVISYYFVIHGIFLVGATQFKGYIFAKTLFTLVLAILSIWAIAYVILYGYTNMDGDYFADASVFERMDSFQFWLILKWAFWWVLAPLCWVLTYMGLKDREG